MRLLPCLLFSIALPISFVSSASQSEDVAAILKVEREICAAFEREDADWLEAHLDPTFTLTSSTGKVTTAAQEVADLRGGTQYDVFRNRDAKARAMASRMRSNSSSPTPTSASPRAG